jgi:hypothetical protein
VLSTEVKVDRLQEQLLLDRLRPVKLAFHDAYGAVPHCLEGTRTQLLAEIGTWMSDPSLQTVYWLKGVAGTGKTTVARSVAIMAEERRSLAASFFFSRTAGDERRRGLGVIPTIAYQLARKYGAFRTNLCRIIESELDICESEQAKQGTKLLSEALADVSYAFPAPLLIVLDALDECDKEVGIEGGNLVPTLLASLSKLPFCVKIFITSRPEATIENLFKRPSIHDGTVALALHRDIEEKVVREDIRLYLQHELEKLAEHRGITTPPPFPSESELENLLERAGTLFIYVRTLLEFISSDVSDPRDQLTLLSHAKVRPASESLDGLYMHIVMEARNTAKRAGITLQRFVDVLASLVLVQENLSVADLAPLIGVEEAECRKILRSMSSVLLHDDKSDEPVRLIHLSFPEFLLDPARCTSPDNLAVDTAVNHLRLAERCLRIMNEGLRENICDIPKPWVSNDEVDDLKERLDQVAPGHLRYASRFWHIHLRNYMHLSGAKAQLPQELGRFCVDHLLHWLELLSLLDEFSYAHQLTSLLSYLRVRTIIISNAPF